MTQNDTGDGRIVVFLHAFMKGTSDEDVKKLVEKLVNFNRSPKIRRIFLFVDSFYKAVLKGESRFASYVGSWKVTQQIKTQGLNKVETVDFGVIASALNALEIDKPDLLLGGYDAPKVVEFILRVIRSEFDNKQLFLRFDIDVEPNDNALLALWRFHQSVSESPQRYLYSGVYGSPNDSSRDLLNDYPVRIDALIPPNGEYDREELENDIKAFFDILKKYGVDPAHQLISGAGFYMHPDIAKRYPPFSNFQSLVTWIDDEIKAELVCKFADYAKAVIPTASFHQLRVTDDEKGIWQQESQFELSTVGTREKLRAWQKKPFEYLDRLVRGCLMHRIIKNRKFQAEVESASAKSAPITTEQFRSTADELRYECYQKIQELLLDFSAFRPKLRPIHYGQDRYSLLNIYPLFCDVEDIIEALVRDCEIYIELVSKWNRSEYVADAVKDQLKAQNQQDPYVSE